MRAEMEEREGRSLSETPTWAFATVISALVCVGFLIHGGLKKCGKWLDRTKRKPLLAALEKIKEELMVFGLLSLLMGHWITFVAKICVKSSALTSRFYPCSRWDIKEEAAIVNHTVFMRFTHLNVSVSRELMENAQNHQFCPPGHESFASKESLEQLHRFLFVLGITHVSFSFVAVALAMIKISSWRRWENHAKSMVLQGLEGSRSSEAASYNTKMRRLSTFIFHHTSHPWSQHKVLVWLLCFSRQFWSSINQADYMALRLGFITTHQLPLMYDFHKYMLRSMEAEFRDIVGIGVHLWIFAISCVLLSFHGTNVYFWISFLPTILLLLVGTKLHRIVVKLAVEIRDETSLEGFHHFNLRDELFWFGRPRFLLLLIQFISFQNAFEVAVYLWSLWEIKGASCFTRNHSFLVIRLAIGVASQIWCSFITFPLYVIVAQMGSEYKKAIISESVKKSLHRWRCRVKAGRQESSSTSSFHHRALTSTTSLNSVPDFVDQAHNTVPGTIEEASARQEDVKVSVQEGSLKHGETDEISECDDKNQVPVCPKYGSPATDDEEKGSL
ncbi:PREDICTED: MLO-like protein 4 [Ipomoea nil]|uniref:MLO-like protein 4 n=1 Tax=Ipomoea nil TaxID=35883 RepID=UPI0009011973|nr:PREDICTED: MLO-like protein 4 [Ipomoea nil]